MNLRPRLLTFAPMIDSETWRLLLRHYGIAYDEEPRAFIWGSLLALARAGTPQVPVFCGLGFSIVDPDNAVDRWDAAQPPGHALIPPDPAMRGVARGDWDLFHGKLATYTARLAYFHLLPHRDILIEPFTRGVPARDARLTRRIYPLQRSLFTLLLQLNPKNAADALARIRAIFDRTDARVRDGRRYLQGERLTLGDIALAAAAAPVILPHGNRSPIPPLEALPPNFAAIVREMQARPTGMFVRRFYEAM